MNNRTFWTSAAVLCAVTVWTAVPGARQGRKKADWLTDRGDPQRTAWRNETILTKDTVKAMTLLWKVRTDHYLGRSRRAHRRRRNRFRPRIRQQVVCVQL